MTPVDQPPLPGRPADAVEAIALRAPAFQPRVALMLGSGLGDLAARVEDPVTLRYDEIPGFYPTGVSGHSGRVVLGYLGGVPVIVLAGRKHMYENPPADAITTPIRALRLMGVDVLLLTCAAGGLRPDLGPGRLMLVTDHINLQGRSVLAGPNDEDVGPRFPSLDGAWDARWNGRLRTAAGEVGVDLADGVYAAWLGPAFETAAEVRMIRLLGADAVGMSMVPECQAARHCGLTVAGIAAITNLGVGLSDQPVSHEQTLRGAALAANDLERTVLRLLETMP